MIDIKNINKNFGEQKVLTGINLTVNKGEVLALIGGSGKGKSVLLKTIIGLLKPDSGQIFINDKDICSLKGKSLKNIKERLGIVFQSSALFDSLNVFDNVAFPLTEKTNLPLSAITQRVRSELSRVDLNNCEDKYPAQLSGGMQKRVALARCLVMNPEIILFDEPTTGLDPIITNTIHNLIKRLQEEKHLTAIIVSHEIPAIFTIVDKVAMLHNGQILATGAPNEIQSSNNEIIQKFLTGEIE